MHYEEEIVYHYMIGLASDSTYAKKGETSMFFEKWFLMWAVEMKDILIMFSTPVMFVFFWPFNLLYAIAQIALEISFYVWIKDSFQYPIKIEIIGLIVKWLGYDDIVAN